MNSSPHLSVSPVSPGRHFTPVFPEAGEDFSLGGFAFDGGEPPAGPGLFVFSRRIGARLYPVLIGEGENLAAAVAQARADEKVLADGLADGLFWLARAAPRQRAAILRELIGKFHPPLNKFHRKGRAVAEIAALIPDRAEGLPEAKVEPVETSEAEIDNLVRIFYASAMDDPLIGPVFGGVVADWEHHFKVVRDFWSRALLGTERYNGSPFTPHLLLKLKPEFFVRWLDLFRAAANETLSPSAARAAIARVEHMSVCFQAGLFPPEAPSISNHT
jgi:truncated hemoglobin YjbI